MAYISGDVEVCASGEARQLIPDILELGFGDIGITTITQPESILVCFRNLNKAYGLGNVIDEEERGKKIMPNLVLSFPADSPDSLDLIIATLKTIREKHFSGLEPKYETVPFEKID